MVAETLEIVREWLLRVRIVKPQVMNRTGAVLATI